MRPLTKNGDNGTYVKYYPSSPFLPSVALGTLLTTNWLQPLMERENHSDCGQPKIMTIKTAKTIATSRPTYHCHPERSAAESKDLVEVAPLVAACRDHSTTLELPSNYSHPLRPKAVPKLYPNLPKIPIPPAEPIAPRKKSSFGIGSQRVRTTTAPRRYGKRSRGVGMPVR